MRRLLIGLALTAAGVLAALAVSTPAARAWSIGSLPAGYTVTHTVDVARPATCPEWYVVQGYGATSGHLCTDSPSFQEALDSFIDSTCPASVCAPPTTTATTDTGTDTTTDTATTSTGMTATTDTTTTSTTPAPGGGSQPTQDQVAITELQQQVADLQATLADLDARLTALEQAFTAAGFSTGFQLRAGISSGGVLNAAGEGLAA